MPGRLTFSILALLLGGCTSPAMPTSDAPASPEPSSSGSASAGAPSESTRPTPSVAVASNTATPTPSPAEDGLEVLDLAVTGCPGGVVVDWSPAMSDEFHHYTALRSLDDEIATDYPPIAPAVDWGDSFATDRFVTSAVDATLIPSETTFAYRVMAYDERNRPVAASPARRTRPTDVVKLGKLVVEPGADGATHLDWSLFGGLGRCFSGYRVLIGPAGSTPSTTLTVVSAQETTELETVGLRGGEAYTVRVEAVRAATLGSFVVARSSTATYEVP
jgi:hypothetical protein